MVTVTSEVMESLNMSKLNLSSVKGDSSGDNLLKTELHDANMLLNIDEDYRCEYREDIWKNLLEQEADKPCIHFQSPQLEYRGTLVQQLREVTKKLGLNLSTLYSAVAQLDLFMDAHRLRSDRLTHVALACLSLAAKSEEKFSRAPTLKTLAKISGVKLCGKTFRQLEWMVGQHVKWRLLAPTPVTYAALLTEYVVTDRDLNNRHPKFLRRFKRDGARLLNAYLDLTLFDMRLRVVECVDVGCACVACARAALGVAAWPAWLAALTGRTPDNVAPVARKLQRMMQLYKSRETAVDNEVDQGYGSAKTSPNQTPDTSPNSTPNGIDTSHKNCSVTEHLLDLEAIDMSYKLNSNNPNEYRFLRSRRLVEDSLTMAEPSMSRAVKRTGIDNIELDRKRIRLSHQLSQVTL